MKGLFERRHVEHLLLEFEVDTSPEGDHVIRVYKRIGKRREQVPDIAPMCHYGYSENDTERNTVYILAAEDLQTLRSIMSLNPGIAADGSLISDIVPSILSYWRRGDRIAEGEGSQHLRIQDTPLQPALNANFDASKGLDVRIGYVLDESGQFVDAGQAKRTRDDGYVRVGDTFARLPGALSQKTQELLQTGSLHVPVDDIPEFFQRDLVLIKKEFQAVLTDLAAQIEVIDEPFLPVVKIDRTPSGWLDFDLEYRVGNLQLPDGLFTDASDQKYYRISDTTWVQLDHTMLERTRAKLELIGAEPTTDGYRIAATQFVSLEEFIDEIGGQREVGVAYRQFLEQLTDFEFDDQYRLPDPLEERLTDHRLQLRPYQRAGIHWLHWLHKNHLHGALADDMGLGKTVQAICALHLAYLYSDNDHHSLIVCPNSVMLHWLREIQRCWPQAQTCVYHGPNRRRDLLLANVPIIFISTYGTVANDLEELAGIPFFYLILDEATRIKNPSAHRTHSMKALNAAHRLALSGTPIENRPAEIWSLFDFLMRGYLGRHGTFTSNFEKSIIDGNERASNGLARRIRPFMLRRLKEDVAKDLPEKIEMKEWCGLSEEQKSLYGGFRDASVRLRQSLSAGENVNFASNILPVLTKLKQICDHPGIVTRKSKPLFGRSNKFDWIVDKITEIGAGSEQVVVFSHFLGMLDLLETAMRDKLVRYLRMDGSTRNRQALIDQFNQDHTITAAILSIQAVGHGVNLTSANHVIHADRWWNPAVEDQATDRVHRIGQDKTVYVYRILTEGTLEARIDYLLETKRGIADRVVGAATRDSGGWTREDLLELLKPLD